MKLLRTCRPVVWAIGIVIIMILGAAMPPWPSAAQAAEDQASPASQPSQPIPPGGSTIGAPPGLYHPGSAPPGYYLPIPQTNQNAPSTLGKPPATQPNQAAAVIPPGGTTDASHPGQYHPANAPPGVYLPIPQAAATQPSQAKQAVPEGGTTDAAHPGQYHPAYSPPGFYVDLPGDN